MRRDRHPCGCVSEHGAERWLELCAKHRAEFDELHNRHRDELAAKRNQESNDATL